MIDILDLRSWSPMSAMTRPSITMLPTAASITRKSASDRDDLPAPVLPTIPICNHITKLIVWILEKLYFISRQNDLNGKNTKAWYELAEARKSCIVKSYRLSHHIHGNSLISDHSRLWELRSKKEFWKIVFTSVISHLDRWINTYSWYLFFTFSLGLTLQSMFFKTSSSPGLYLVP